ARPLSSAKPLAAPNVSRFHRFRKAVLRYSPKRTRGILFLAAFQLCHLVSNVIHGFQEARFALHMLGRAVGRFDRHLLQDRSGRGIPRHSSPNVTFSSTVRLSKLV